MAERERSEWIQGRRSGENAKTKGQGTWVLNSRSDQQSTSSSSLLSQDDSFFHREAAKGVEMSRLQGGPLRVWPSY